MKLHSHLCTWGPCADHPWGCESHRSKHHEETWFSSRWCHRTSGCCFVLGMGFYISLGGETLLRIKHVKQWATFAGVMSIRLLWNLQSKLSKRGLVGVKHWQPRTREKVPRPTVSPSKSSCNCEHPVSIQTDYS